jgi:biotin carboxyl carrier protein
MHVQLRHKHEHLTLDVHPDGARHRVVVGDSVHVVETHRLDDASVVLVVDGKHYRVAIARNGKERLVAVNGEAYSFTPETGPATAHNLAALAAPEIIAPMPGKVLQVLVKAGDQVSAGDGLVILEAMKMENRLVAEAAGTVSDVRVADGDMVQSGQVLVVLTYA